MNEQFLDSAIEFLEAEAATLKEGRKAQLDAFAASRRALENADAAIRGLDAVLCDMRRQREARGAA